MAVVSTIWSTMGALAMLLAKKQVQFYAINNTQNAINIPLNDCASFCEVPLIHSIIARILGLAVQR